MHRPAGTGVISVAALWERVPSLKYLMVGACCALLNLLIQYCAVQLLGAHYVVGVLLSFVILVPLSFFIHKNVTFRTEGKLSWRRFALYSTQWIVLLVVNILLMALFFDVLHIPHIPSILLVTGTSTVLSYGYSRKHVFQQESTVK